MGVSRCRDVSSENPVRSLRRTFRISINDNPRYWTGAYAEYIAVSTHMLIHKPKELSWEEAAGIPEVSTIVTANSTQSKEGRESCGLVSTQYLISCRTATDLTFPTTRPGSLPLKQCI